MSDLMPRARRVLFVGWSGADWSIIHPLMDTGKLPVLKLLIERGAMASPNCPVPLDQAMLWTSLATGQRAESHGVFSFGKVREGDEERVDFSDWKAEPFWKMLGESGKRCLVCNWPLSSPVTPDSGILVSDRPFEPGGVFPPELCDELAELVATPQEMDQSILQLLVPSIAEVDQERDDRLGQLATILAKNFTIHQFFTRLLEEKDWDLAAVCYPAIQEVCAAFERYALPLRPGVWPKEAKLYGEVVEGIYRLHDAMLERLLSLAGEDITVIIASENGFLGGEDRPLEAPRVNSATAIASRRRQSILVAAGPGIIEKDVLLGGGQLLDLAPSILDLLGVDSSGLPGTPLFSETTSVRRPTPIWEDVEDIVCSEDLEWEWKRAQSYADAVRWVEAVFILEELMEREPERADFLNLLVQGLQYLGLDREAENAIAESPFSGTPRHRFFQATLALKEKDYIATRELLRELVADETLPADLNQKLAFSLLQARLFNESETVFLRMKGGRDGDSVALAGLAYCRTRRGLPQEAEKLARESLALRPDYFWGQYVLGLSLLVQNHVNEATIHFRKSLAIAPNYEPARKHLIAALRRSGKSEDVEAEKIRLVTTLQPTLDEQSREKLLIRLRGVLDDRRRKRN